MTTKFNRKLSFNDFNKKVKARQKSRQVMLEKTVEKDVKSYARSLGVIARKYVSTAHPSVPDGIFMFDNGIVIFIEFKRPGKKLTGKQARELYEMQQKGHFVYVIDNISLGRLIIDRFVEYAQKGERPTLNRRSTEAQWQSISDAKDRITAAT